MNVDLGIWPRLTRLIMFLLLVAALLAVAVWYMPLIQQNERMRKEILRLDAEIKHEQEKTRQMEATIHALRTDPRAVERLAREKLGYAKPGETVIVFEDQESPGSPQP